VAKAAYRAILPISGQITLRKLEDGIVGESTVVA
jgi:hypothetical protein